MALPAVGREADHMRTLTAAGEIDSLFKTGRRGSTGPLVVISAITPARRGPDGRVLFVAGKKVGGAVARNRCKRVLREAARRAGAPWPGFDVAIVARVAVATASATTLDAALREGLRKAGVL
jgi:ribonuclease P protein component